jgi:hypothetical protein
MLLCRQAKKLSFSSGSWNSGAGSYRFIHTVVFPVQKKNMQKRITVLSAAHASSQDPSQQLDPLKKSNFGVIGAGAASLRCNRS